MEHLIGCWALERVVEYDGEGVATDHYGGNPSGQLIYTAEGAMAVVIAGIADREKSPAVSYAGEVSTDGTVVRHHVRVGSPPFVGDLIRFARLEGDDRLALASDQPGRPRVELCWTRLSSRR